MYEHAGSINVDNVIHKYIQESHVTDGKHVLLEKKYTRTCILIDIISEN
jgi:hypothetical protein